MAIYSGFIITIFNHCRYFFTNRHSIDMFERIQERARRFVLRDPVSSYDVLLENAVSLYWRHNGRNGVSNHQPLDCLINRLFRPRSKKASKLRVTGLCAWNSPGTGNFTAKMASDAKNVSIWWRLRVWMDLSGFVSSLCYTIMMMLLMCVSQQPAIVYAL